MPKFFSMSAMMFMIIYIYTTVRDTKDTLVVSTCGAESITFLKVIEMFEMAQWPELMVWLNSNRFMVFSQPPPCSCFTTLASQTCSRRRLCST